MIPKVTAAIKRIPIVWFLLLLVLATVILLIGLVSKGLIPLPNSLAQRLPFGLNLQPTAVAQASLPDATPTKLTDKMPAPTAAPDSPTPNATGKSIVTVITLTPTGAVSQTTLVNEEGQITGPAETPTLPVSLTPSPSATAQSTSPQTIVPTIVTDQSVPVTLAQIRTEMQNLDQMMHATRVMMQILAQSQPTTEELASLRAQLIVVAQRMSRLATQLQVVQAVAVSVPTATPEPVAKATVSSDQVGDLLTLMQQALETLQGVLADPATDSATLVQAQELLSQLQGMMEQVQILMVSTQTTDQSNPIPITPTMIPSPTITVMPTATPTTASATNDGWQTIFSDIEQLLDEMQSIIESSQNGLGTVTPTP